MYSSILTDGGRRRRWAHDWSLLLEWRGGFSTANKIRLAGPWSLSYVTCPTQCCTEEEVAFWCWGSKRKREADGDECLEEEVSLGVRARAR